MRKCQRLGQHSSWIAPSRTPSTRNLIGPFGRGWEWTDGWQRVLSQGSDGTVFVTDADGSQRVFQPDSRGGYFADPGDCCTLSSVSGGFSLHEKDGGVTDFGPDGRVADVQDLNGNRVTAAYTNGLLTSLSASAGQSLSFTYNTAGLITGATDSTGRKTTYSYDPNNQYLLSVTDFAGRTTSYTYSSFAATKGFTRRELRLAA